MSCLPKHDISYTYLVEDRAEFHANEECVEIALSYRFPTCMKSKFLSSDDCVLIVFASAPTPS